VDHIDRPCRGTLCRPTSKGRGGKGEEDGREGKGRREEGKGWEGKGREWEGTAPLTQIPGSALNIVKFRQEIPEKKYFKEKS